MIRQLVDTFGKILPQSAPTVKTAVLFFSAIIVVLNQKPIQYIKKKSVSISSEHRGECSEISKLFCNDELS